MNSFTPERLEELRKKFENKKIAIIGDMMLDCYFLGRCKTDIT